MARKPSFFARETLLVLLAMGTYSLLTWPLLTAAPRGMGAFLYLYGVLGAAITGAAVWAFLSRKGPPADPPEKRG